MLLALAGSLGVAVLSLAVASLASIEVRVNTAHRWRQEACAAAELMLETTLKELAAEADWNDVLAGIARSARGESPTVEVAGWGVLSATALTARLQAEADASNALGADGPVWRLYRHGFATDMRGLHGESSRRFFGLAWVADDPAEIDANPGRDANGIVIVRAEVYGAGPSRSGVTAGVERKLAGLAVLTWQALEYDR